MKNFNYTYSLLQGDVQMNSKCTNAIYNGYYQYLLTFDFHEIDVEKVTLKRIAKKNGLYQKETYQVDAYVFYCDSTTVGDSDCFYQYFRGGIPADNQYDRFRELIDTSGDGSENNPWKNVEYALERLICFARNTCDKYFILKVSGKINYQIYSGVFNYQYNPISDYRDKIILDFEDADFVIPDKTQIYSYWGGDEYLDYFNATLLAIENMYVKNVTLDINKELYNSNEFELVFNTSHTAYLYADGCIFDNVSINMDISMINTESAGFIYFFSGFGRVWFDCNINANFTGGCPCTFLGITTCAVDSTVACNIQIESNTYETDCSATGFRTFENARYNNTVFINCVADLTVVDNSPYRYGYTPTASAIGFLPDPYTDVIFINCNSTTSAYATYRYESIGFYKQGTATFYNCSQNECKTCRVSSDLTETCNSDYCWF